MKEGGWTFMFYGDDYRIEMRFRVYQYNVHNGQWQEDSLCIE